MGPKCRSYDPEMQYRMGPGVGATYGSHVWCGVAKCGVREFMGLEWESMVRGDSSVSLRVLTIWTHLMDLS